MEMMQVFWALLAGFAVITVLMLGFTMALRKAPPDWVSANGRPTPAYVLANLGYSFLAAAAGGFVSAWMERGNPLGGSLALAIVVLVMSAVSALEQRGKQPLALHVALLVISPAGVFLGGLIRLWAMGVTWTGSLLSGS